MYTPNGGNTLSFRSLVVRWTISTVVVPFTRAHFPEQHTALILSAFKSRIWSRSFILIRFVTCVMFVIMIIAVESPHRYFFFLVIPLLMKWTMSGDTWSLTSIPLYADAAKSMTAKIHLCLLTKRRHTASSLCMFVLSRHSITLFDNYWATSRSVDSVLNWVHTCTFCRWVFERPVRSWHSCVPDTFRVCYFSNPMRNSAIWQVCKVDEHAILILKAIRDY